MKSSNMWTRAMLFARRKWQKLPTLSVQFWCFNKCPILRDSEMNSESNVEDISRCLEHVENTWLCLVRHLQTKLCTKRTWRQWPSCQADKRFKCLCVAGQTWLVKKCPFRWGALKGKNIENCGPSCVNNIFLHGKVGLPKGNVVFWFWESIMWYCVRCILSHSYPWLVYNPYILLVISLFFSCLHSRWFDAKHPHPVSHLHKYLPQVSIEACFDLSLLLQSPFLLAKKLQFATLPRSNPKVASFKSELVKSDICINKSLRIHVWNIYLHWPLK